MNRGGGLLQYLQKGSFCRECQSVGGRGGFYGRRDCGDPSYFQAIANGSVVSWQHINLLGEYDFSDEKLQDSVGISPPKLAA